MSVASVVIMSITFAFVQYVEIAARDRVREMSQRIKDVGTDDEGTLSGIWRKIGFRDPEAEERRAVHDMLVNVFPKEGPMRPLKSALFFVLGALAVLHATSDHMPLIVEILDRSRDLDNVLAKPLAFIESSMPVFVRISWWAVLAVMAWAGLGMRGSLQTVRRYEAFVDDFASRQELPVKLNRNARTRRRRRRRPPRRKGPS